MQCCELCLERCKAGFRCLDQRVGCGEGGLLLGIDGSNVGGWVFDLCAIVDLLNLWDVLGKDRGKVVCTKVNGSLLSWELIKPVCPATL